jgi:hypothetical protein
VLILQVGATEAWDEEAEKFTSVGGTPVELEHSLLSLSKWESKFEKPFLTKEQKTQDETLTYIEMMAVSSNFPPGLFLHLTNENFDTVNEYLLSKQTATWFNDPQGPNARSQEVITAEIIYYWMVSLSIPFECETWHLNKLLTLIKVCNQKNQPPKKKTNMRNLAEQRRNLNAERKARMGTSG